MSATVNAERFSDYLSGAPILRVPGRTFPVQELYLEDAVETTGYKVEEGGRNSGSKNNDDNDAELEDSTAPIGTENLKRYSSQTRATLSRMDERQIPYDLILQLLIKIAASEQYADFSKAILVFLPGLGEIRRLNDMILGHPMFGSGPNKDKGWLVYPLHSTIASEDQEQAFLIPPPGRRKIVLATNIAETGITIPDVTAVIDTGKHKEMRFDEKRQLSRLIETYISRANAKQRRGRAGRVQPGICWHLFTKDRYEQSMADQQTPEIMRLSLQDLCLRVKICGLGNVEEVLTSALDSPSTKNIRRAVESLVEVKALTSGEELTPLGRQLAKLPLDVYLGKLVLLGSLFSCLDATVTIAALLTSKSPFISPIGYGVEANTIRLSFKRGDSDLLTGYNAYSAWRRVCQNRNISEAEFCRKNYLSSRTLSGIEDLKTQLFASLVDAGFLNLSAAERQQLSRARYSSYRRTFFIPPDPCNTNSTNDTIISATTAFYPKLLARDGRGWRNILSNGKLVRVHHNSVNSMPPSEDSDWLAYYSLMQTRNGGYDAHETTCIQSFVVALLCGDAEWRLYSGVMNVDGNRIRFALPDWRGVVVVKALRKRVREIVNRAWKNPERGLREGEEKWLKAFWEALGGLEKRKE
jgi:ATP-dependent RNA helicase DHX29